MAIDARYLVASLLLLTVTVVHSVVPPYTFKHITGTGIPALGGGMSAWADINGDNYPGKLSWLSGFF